MHAHNACTHVHAHTYPHSRPWDSPGKNIGVGCHVLLQCMKVKSESEGAQSCLTPSNPMDCSLPGSSVHGIFQARVLEWVAIAFSNAWKWKVKVKSLSRVRFLANPWTAAYQVSPVSSGYPWSLVPKIPYSWDFSSLSRTPNFSNFEPLCLFTFCPFHQILFVLYFRDLLSIAG